MLFQILVIFSLQNNTRVPCGYAAQADVSNVTKLDDRMDSFFLSETVKYLYLLFDASVEGWLQVGKEGGRERWRNNYKFVIPYSLTSFRPLPPSFPPSLLPSLTSLPYSAPSVALLPGPMPPLLPPSLLRPPSLPPSVPASRFPAPCSQRRGTFSSSNRK